jgi:hypothetical protein
MGSGSVTPTDTAAPGAPPRVAELPSSVWKAPGNSGQDAPAALREENEQLRQAIRSRAVIEQAKGALMLRFGIEDSAAFAVLRRWSQDSNVKLRTVAETLVNLVCSEGSQTGEGHALAQWLHDQIHWPEYPREAARLPRQPVAEGGSANVPVRCALRGCPWLMRLNLV